MVTDTIAVFAVVLVAGVGLGVNPTLSFVVAAAAAFGKIILKIAIGL